VRSKENYTRDYIDSAKQLRIDLEIPTQQIAKTSEAAWAVDTYLVEPGDEPAERSPLRRIR
jgi:hypothetical protein